MEIADDQKPGIRIRPGLGKNILILLPCLRRRIDFPVIGIHPDPGLSFRKARVFPAAPLHGGPGVIAAFAFPPPQSAPPCPAGCRTWDQCPGNRKCHSRCHPGGTAHRGEPDSVNPQVLQVIQSGDNSLQTSYAVPVAVRKAAGVNPVDDGGFPPFALIYSVCHFPFSFLHRICLIGSNLLASYNITYQTMLPAF